MPGFPDAKRRLAQSRRSIIHIWKQSLETCSASWWNKKKIWNEKEEKKMKIWHLTILTITSGQTKYQPIKLHCHRTGSPDLILTLENQIFLQETETHSIQGFNLPQQFVRGCRNSEILILLIKPPWNQLDLARTNKDVICPIYISHESTTPWWQPRLSL